MAESLSVDNRKSKNVTSYTFVSLGSWDAGDSIGGYPTLLVGFHCLVSFVSF